MSPCNDPRKKPKTVWRPRPAVVQINLNQDLTIPKQLAETGSQRFSVSAVTDRLINWLTWENGHLPADEMEVLSVQHHNCLVLFFMALKTTDKVTPTTTQKKTQMNAAKIDTSRHATDGI